MPNVSPADIENLSKDIDALRVTFYDAIKGIVTTEINAGGLPEADPLETKTKNGTTAVGAVRDSINAALTTIVSNLKTSASIYGGAEEDNRKAGEQLDTLIADLKKNLPGFDPDDE